MANLLTRSVLQIAQAAADRIGFSRPSTLSDTINLNDRRFLQAAQWAMRDIAKENPPSLVREYTFYTRSSVEAYPLPGDFGGFVPSTNWNRSANWQNELVPAAVWQQNKSGIAATAISQRFRVKAYSEAGGRFFIDPVPSTAEQFVFEYQSNALFREASASPANSRRFYVKTKTSGAEIQVAHVTTSVTIPSVFLVSFGLDSTGGMKLEGKIFTVSSATTSGGRNKAWLQGTDGRDFASATVNYREVVNYLTSGSLLEQAWPMVDSDLMEQGMVWRLKRMTGQPYAADKQDFDDSLERYIGKKRGASIVSLSGSRSMSFPANVPEGNWPQS